MRVFKFIASHFFWHILNVVIDHVLSSTQYHFHSKKATLFVSDLWDYTYICTLRCMCPLTISALISVMLWKQWQKWLAMIKTTDHNQPWAKWFTRQIFYDHNMSAQWKSNIYVIYRGLYLCGKCCPNVAEMSPHHDNLTNLSWHRPCLATSAQPVPFYGSVTYRDGLSGRKKMRSTLSCEMKPMILELGYGSSLCFK